MESTCYLTHTLSPPNSESPTPNSELRTPNSAYTPPPPLSSKSLRGSCRDPKIPMATTDRLKMMDPAQEIEQARSLASRYRCEFVDLQVVRIDHELFHSVPVDLMFRYNFVPITGQNGTLEIALSDPRNLNLIDELSVLLQKKLKVKVATLTQISELLKKTEQSQRVLEEVTEGFALDVLAGEENADETLSIDKLSASDSDIAPVIKLVDTTIFDALERRASDIHVETRDQEVAIKY